MKAAETHNDFVLSLAGHNIDLTIVNIEEMAGYCKARKRLASVVTEKKTYGELEKLNYSLIMNYKSARPRVINTKSKQYVGVFSSLAERYKKGLLIVETDTLSDDISDILCNHVGWQANDVDIMVCRNLQTFTEAELKRANLLRISADPDYDATIIEKYNDYLEERSLTLMICQLFANENFNIVKAYLDRANQHFTDQGIKEYIDYYEMNKQIGYFVYFDIEANKILNIDAATMSAFLRRVSEAGILPIPEAHIQPIVEMITL